MLSYALETSIRAEHVNINTEIESIIMTGAEVLIQQSEIQTKREVPLVRGMRKSCMINSLGVFIGVER